jgi:hypothetical protein
MDSYRNLQPGSVHGIIEFVATKDAGAPYWTCFGGDDTSTPRPNGVGGSGAQVKGMTIRPIS